jgi:hypothetical protein
VARDQLEQQLAEPMLPKITAVNQACPEREQMARNLSHRIAQVLVAQSQRRHVRALGG